MGNLYRDGVLAREKETAVKEACYKAIEAAGGDPAMKGNFIIGLIHVGYEDAAFEAIEKYRGEEWFAKNWDVNFFSGTLHFRHRLFKESIPFFEAANSIESSEWVRLWYSMALAEGGEEDKARRAELFPWDHMGPGNGEGSRSRTRPTSTGSEDGI